MKKICILLPFCALLSCVGDNVKTNRVGGDTDSITVVDIVEDDVCSNSVRLGHDSLFCIELVENNKLMTEQERICYLTDSSFWKEDTLTKEQYVLLFNYLIDHQSDDKSELIADFMYEHFKTDASFKHFDLYFRLNPDDAILESLTFDLVSAWNNENEAISEIEFKKRYKYLYNKGCVKYFRTLKTLEK